jgi:hypothetical protein
MQHPQVPPTQAHYSNSKTHSQRVDSVYAQESYAQQPLYAANNTPSPTYVGQGIDDMSLRHVGPTLSHGTRSGTQLLPIRSMKPQNKPIASSPRSFAHTPQETCTDNCNHRSTLHAHNPGPPHRKSWTEVAAEQGEPLAKPRIKLVAQRLYLVEHDFGQV